MVSGADDNSRPRLREEVRDGFDRVVKTEQIFKPKWEIGTGNSVCVGVETPPIRLLLIRLGGLWSDSG